MTLAEKLMEKWAAGQVEEASTKTEPKLTDGVESIWAKMRRVGKSAIKDLPSSVAQGLNREGIGDFPTLPPFKVNPKPSVAPKEKKSITPSLNAPLNNPKSLNALSSPAKR